MPHTNIPFLRYYKPRNQVSQNTAPASPAPNIDLSCMKKDRIDVRH